MEEQEIFLNLEKVFKKVFNNSALIIKKETTAEDVDNWDSLSHMLLITEIENAFSIKFKLKELNKMKNVGDMIDLITSKIQ